MKGFGGGQHRQVGASENPTLVALTPALLYRALTLDHTPSLSIPLTYYKYYHVSTFAVLTSLPLQLLMVFESSSSSSLAYLLVSSPPVCSQMGR